MRNVLIIFIVVLAGYLLINQPTEKNVTGEILEETAIETPDKEISSNAVEVKLNQAVAVLPSESFATDVIDLTYTSKLDNDTIKATLRFTFNLDGTFIDTREMDKPKSLAGEALGTYTINGANILLMYNDNRDKNIFKFNKSEMTLQKDGSLRTGSVVLTPQ